MKLYALIAAATLMASPVFAQTAAPGSTRTMDAASPAKAETTKPDADMHRSSTTAPGGTTTDNKQTITGGQPGGSTQNGR